MMKMVFEGRVLQGLGVGWKGRKEEGIVQRIGPREMSAPKRTLYTTYRLGVGWKGRKEEGGVQCVGPWEVLGLRLLSPNLANVGMGIVLVVTEVVSITQQMVQPGRFLVAMAHPMSMAWIMKQWKKMFWRRISL